MIDENIYQVRVSTRAKRMRIKISPLGQVEVVVPKRAPKFEVDLFVQSNIDWINKTQQKLTALRNTDPDLGFDPPDNINLVAIEAIFTVNYHPIAHKISVVEEGRNLKIYANNDDERRDALRFWLQEKAKQTLVPWVNQVANELGFKPNKVFIKAQKTRWGSCSSKKNINLNRNLLFVPPELVRYLFVHELCHLKHLNHSKEYWELVERCEPEFKQLDLALNRATRDVPLWVMNGK